MDGSERAHATSREPFGRVARAASAILACAVLAPVFSIAPARATTTRTEDVDRLFDRVLMGLPPSIRLDDPRAPGASGRAFCGPVGAPFYEDVCRRSVRAPGYDRAPLISRAPRPSDEWARRLALGSSSRMGSREDGYLNPSLPRAVVNPLLFWVPFESAGNWESTALAMADPRSPFVARDVPATVPGRGLRRYDRGEIGAVYVNGLAEWAQASLRLTNTLRPQVRPEDPRLDGIVSQRERLDRLSRARRRLRDLEGAMAQADALDRATRTRDALRSATAEADTRWRNALAAAARARAALASRARAASALRASAEASVESSFLWCGRAGRALGLCDLAFSSARDAAAAAELEATRAREAAVVAEAEAERAAADLWALMARQPDAELDVAWARRGPRPETTEPGRTELGRLEPGPSNPSPSDRSIDWRARYLAGVDEVRRAAGFGVLPVEAQEWIRPWLQPCRGEISAFFSDGDFGPAGHPLLSGDVEPELLPPGDGRLLVCAEDGKLTSVGVAQQGLPFVTSVIARGADDSVAEIRIRDRGLRVVERLTWSNEGNRTAIGVEFLDPRLGPTPIVLHATVPNAP